MAWWLLGKIWLFKKEAYPVVIRRGNRLLPPPPLYPVTSTYIQQFGFRRRVRIMPETGLLCAASAEGRVYSCSTVKEYYDKLSRRRHVGFIENIAKE
jgi:hypothetical protein